MSARSAQWQSILDAEVKRWSALSCEQLVSQLRELQSYEVERDSKAYQVEVELLENTETYVHVMVGIDDGRLPASMWPLTESFIRQKQP